MASEAEKISLIVKRCLSDPTVPPETKHRIAEMLTSGLTEFEVWELLVQLSDAEIDSLETKAADPEDDLGKVVPAGSFVRHYVRPEYSIAGDLQPESAVVGLLEEEVDEHGELRILAWLKDGELVPRRNSWLAPLDSLLGKSSGELALDLRLISNETYQTGPFVRMEFPKALAKAFGVKVRKPSRFDTVATRDIVWIEGAVPDELINGSIDRQACGGTGWHS